MGNNGSRRKSGKGEIQEESDDDMSEDTLNRLEDLEGTTPDSYDKLLSWMIEMAQNDDVNLESPTFVEHITNVCAEKRDKMSVSGDYLRPNMPIRQHSLDSSVIHRVAPTRQHSYDASCSSRYSRSPRSKEDLLDPRTRFRRTMLSRQSTVDYSDDGDTTPMDISGGSSFDQDSDTDIVNPQAILINPEFSETSFTKSPNTLKPQMCSNSGHTYQSLSNSVGDLLHRGYGINSTVRKKSKSLWTMKRNMSETRTDDEITPITEETVVKILDDSLLDSNMADILYSVEALWPKVPK